MPHRTVINPYKLKNPRVHRYWRLLFTGLAGGATSVALDEIEFWDRPGARRFVGGTYSASGELSAAQAATFAVDGLLASVGGGGMWSSQVAGAKWYQLDAGANQDFELAAVALAKGNYALGTNAPPTSFDVQWSDDGVTWTTLWSEAAIPTGWDQLDVRTYFNPGYLGDLGLIFPGTAPKFWLNMGSGVFKDAGVTPAVDGDTIQQITNLGSGAAFTQATAGARPTFKTGGLNGKPYLLGASGKWLADIAIDSTGGVPGQSIFAVMSDVDVTQESALIGYGAGPGMNTLYMRSAAGQILYAKGAWAFGAVTSPLRLYVAAQDLANLVYRVNGTYARLIDGTGFPFGAATQQFLRDTFFGHGGYFKGRLYEFIDYGSIVPALAANKIDKYLKAKYAL